MKKFLTIGILLLSICICSVACNNTYEPTNDSIATVVNDEPHPILFDFGNIDTVVYLDNNNATVLHYCDYDVFDYDNLAYLTGRKHWYGDYVAINVEDEILQEFLVDYSKYIENKDYNTREHLNDKYIIIEHDITYQDGTRDFIYYIAIDDAGNN